uniref:Alginate lyase family protein n=1 Tax=Thermodesulfobium narugense TaxID=184064 RepID=A0A7C5P7W9_9BACT
MKSIKIIARLFLLFLYKLFLFSGFYWLFKGRFISSESTDKNCLINELNILKGIYDIEKSHSQIPLNLVNKTIEEADRICEHKFDIFDKTFSFGKDIQWRMSENFNYVWPNKKWFLLNLNDRKAGDPKYTWELNRFNHLSVLGRAYSISKDKKYYEEFKSEVLSWILQNPPEKGINWNSNLEISLRAISWIVAYEFFKEEIEKDYVFKNKFTSTLFKFGKHIYENIYYSEFFLRNNHLVGEIVGLFLISFFLECKESLVWREKAFYILKKEIPNQIRDDGSSIENSASYSIFSLYLLLILLIVFNRRNLTFDDLLLNKIQKGLKIARAMLKPDGSFPNYGDSDDAKVLLLSDFSQIEDLMNIASVLFNREEYKASSEKGFCSSVFWIFGMDGIKRFESMRLNFENEEIVFCENGKIGFYNNRRGDNLFVQLTNASSHGHSGVGNFELSIEGIDLILDSGTYKYNVSREERNYFRSTFAHNVLIVDSIPHDIPLKKFRWIGNSTVNRVWYNKSPVNFGVEYDFPRFGFSKMRHRREFFLYNNDGFLVIIDFLSGRGTHLVEEIFHLSPLVERAEFYSDNSFECKIKDLRFSLVCGYSELSKSMKRYFMHGTISKHWFSPKYGVKVLAPTIIFQQRLRTPLLVITLLNWCSKDSLKLYNDIFSNVISSYIT